MTRAILLLMIPLLAGCGRDDGDEPAGRNEPREPVQIADLTGLYEAGEPGGRSARMCMISGPTGAALFAIVTETPDGFGCGGAGEAVRQPGLLRLTMGGDEDCVIDAPIAGAQVTLPPTLPEGCAYYCAPGATLAGTAFEKTGGTVEDAMLALDPAGDPLCG